MVDICSFRFDKRDKMSYIEVLNWSDISMEQFSNSPHTEMEEPKNCVDCRGGELAQIFAENCMNCAIGTALSGVIISPKSLKKPYDIYVLGRKI